VQRVKVGDRVALDTSAPCGTCEKCRAGRLVECRRPASYWGRTMGFADFMIAPWQLMFPAGDLPAHHACLVEPMGVSLDLVDVADVEAGSRVLIIGPGPLGLLAIPDCVRRGAARIWMAGRSHSVARLDAAATLGAEVIKVDETPLEGYDWGGEAPDRILVVAPPDQIPLAAKIGARSAIISYIGIAFDAKGTLPFDFDAFHFKRMQLRSSMHGPATRSLDSLAILQSGCFDPDVVISEHFPLAKLEDAMTRNRDDKTAAKKLVMTRPEAGW
jgi:L-iditol 2-dehydrogenase